MRILLIKPPFNPKAISVSIYEPLELEYLAAAVSNHVVKILDMRIDQNLQRALRTFDPHLVGITGYTCSVNTIKSILTETKKHNRSIKTVVGGNHATFVPNDFNEPMVDAIFFGYADQSFRQYADYLAEGIALDSVPNIGIVENGKINFTVSEKFNVDLNSLPLPARNLVSQYQKKYRDNYRNRISLIMTSRGCPFRCSFCSCWKIMKGHYVTRNVRSIMEELHSLPEEIKVVHFSDDNTFNDVDRAWELQETLEKDGFNKKFQMFARTDTIVKHPELFRKFNEIGLQYLTVGFESFRDEDLKKFNKKTTIALNNKAIEILKRSGIYIMAHFLVKPDYEEKEFQQLYNYVKKNNLFRTIYPVLTPLPGTKLYEDNKDNLVIDNYDFFDCTHAIIPTKLSRKNFYHQLTLLYAKSYSAKRYIRFKLAKARLLKKINGYITHTDGITLLKILLLAIFAGPMLRKLKRAYQTEEFSG